MKTFEVRISLTSPSGREFTSEAAAKAAAEREVRYVLRDEAFVVTEDKCFVFHQKANKAFGWEIVR